MSPNTIAPDVTPTFSAGAVALILDAEGLDQPGKWPGGDSGVTIGHGYDLGYTAAADYATDWRSLLDQGDYIRLLDAIAVKGSNARDLAPHFRDIRIKGADADAVFKARTIPQQLRLTRNVFPGFDNLPLDAQGALVSLVYNRGAFMGAPSPAGKPLDSRFEMRAIRDAVGNPDGPDLDEIAAQLRAMKRLWVGKGEDGLLTRRDAEAALVEQSA